MLDLVTQAVPEPPFGIALLGVLAALALLDSLSFGTLLIPVWLLMAPGRVRLGRLGVYLATVLLFYFAVGVLLLFAADAIMPLLSPALGSPLWSWGLLVVGLLLCAWSFVLDARSKRKPAGGGKLMRWRTRALGDERGIAALAPLMVLAVSAVAIELASMLPYLAAIGIISSSNLGTAPALGLLAGYCVVMLLPAFLLSLGRLVAANALRPPLARLETWMTKNASGATSWIVGAVGFILALNAASDIGII